MKSIPPPATEPDDGRNPTWEPETFPGHPRAAGYDSRTTLKCRQPQGERRTTFEKLVVQTPDGETGRRARRPGAPSRGLIVKHDPQPGDLVAITAFGPDEKGWHEYGLNVDKSARDQLPDAEEAEELFEEASS